MPDRIESEYLNAIVAEQTEIRMVGILGRTIQRVLKARVVEVPTDIARSLEALDSEQLIELPMWADSCLNLDSFREKLTQ